MQGTIKKMNDNGYGFISPEEGDKDVFFHANDVTDEVGFKGLNEGDSVSFEMGESPKGPKATNVTLGGGGGAAMGDDDAGAGDDAAASDDDAAASDEESTEE